MRCIYLDAKKNQCNNPACYASDFCQQHIATTQNACNHARKRSVKVYDKDMRRMVSKAVSETCGKMRKPGSQLCPHHDLIETEKLKAEKKTTAQRLGGYSR